VPDKPWALAAANPVAVIVLGGAHELAREIQRLSNGQAEYFRVVLAAYRKADSDPKRQRQEYNHAR
jgi:hypothetical protein